MKFTPIPFQSSSATRIYRDYLSRVEHSVRTLDKENRQEILLEINSHVYEGISDNPARRDEVEQLLDVLEKLGQPEVFLKPLVAKKQLEEATRTFNPIKVAKALVLNIGNGISYVLFSLLYLFLFGFLFLIVAKLVNPDQVGFFYRANEFFIIGHYSTADGTNYIQYERLGNWFIPVMLLAAALLYLLLTLLLKLKKNLNFKTV